MNSCAINFITIIVLLLSSNKIQCVQILSKIDNTINLQIQLNSIKKSNDTSADAFFCSNFGKNCYSEGLISINYGDLDSDEIVMLHEGLINCNLTSFGIDEDAFDNKIKNPKQLENESKCYTSHPGQFTIAANETQIIPINNSTNRVCKYGNNSNWSDILILKKEESLNCTSETFSFSNSVTKAVDDSNSNYNDLESSLSQSRFANTIDFDDNDSISTNSNPFNLNNFLDFSEPNNDDSYNDESFTNKLADDSNKALSKITTVPLKSNHECQCAILYKPIWKYCTSQDQVCNTTGVIRYGNNGSYVYKYLSEKFICDNVTLGEPKNSNGNFCWTLKPNQSYTLEINQSSPSIPTQRVCRLKDNGLVQKTKIFPPNQIFVCNPQSFEGIIPASNANLNCDCEDFY